LFLFLVSVQSLENQAPTVRSNAVSAVERTAAYSRTFAQLRTPVTPLRASTAPDGDAVRLCVRTQMYHVRTHLQNCHILLLHERTCCPALERTSASCINIPEAVRSVLFFFFSFVYLLIILICF
jgi:hypothetical protein